MQFASYTMDKKGRLVASQNPMFVSGSWFQDQLSSLPGATKFQHNGFNNNEIYVEIPQELYDYETTPERKEQIRKQLV